MAELEFAERLVVWTFRTWLAGDEQRPHVWREYRRHMNGADAVRAVTGFGEMIATLRRHARRSILHHRPCCQCLGHDEVTLAVIVNAMQADHLPLATAAARWLVRAEGAATFLAAVRGYADALARNDLLLPEARIRPPRPTAPPRPRVAVLH